MPHLSPHKNITAQHLKQRIILPCRALDLADCNTDSTDQHLPFQSYHSYFQNLYIASLVWQTNWLNDHFLFAICEETVNVWRKAWFILWIVLWLCSWNYNPLFSFFLSGLLMIWLRTLWWPSHSYMGWTISAWIMNPWCTLLTFCHGTIWRHLYEKYSYNIYLL